MSREEQQREAMSAAEEGIGEVEEIPEAYLHTLDDQLDILVDAHEQTERRIVEALEQIESQVEQAQEEGKEQAEELRERVEDFQEQMQPPATES